MMAARERACGQSRKTPINTDRLHSLMPVT